MQSGFADALRAFGAIEAENTPTLKSPDWVELDVADLHDGYALSI